MAQVVLLAIFLAGLLGILGTALPSLNFLSYLPGWSQAVAIINYGFFFIEPTVFITCLGLIIMLEQADLIWSGVNWVITTVKP